MSVPLSELERWGSHAADLAIRSHVPLEDAVVQVVRDNPHINGHALQSLCWEANVGYHRKVASARKEAGMSLRFEYDLARPEKVAARCGAGPGLTRVVAVDDDYLATPKKIFGHTEHEIKLAALGRQPLDQEWAEKTATAHPASIAQSAQVEARHLWRSMTKIAEESKARLSRCRNESMRVLHRMQRTEEALYDHFKSAALQGTSLASMLDLFSIHEDHRDLAHQTATELAARFCERDAHAFGKWASVSSYEDAPAGRPNPSHPLAQLFHTYATLCKESEVVRVAEKVASADVESTVYGLTQLEGALTEKGLSYV